MKKWLFISSLLLLASCVEQIEFDAPDQVGVLVVDGLLSTFADSNFVRLLRTDVLGKRVYPPEAGAKISVVDEFGNREEYEHVKDGYYFLPQSQIRVLVGGTYHLEIETANGRQYKSLPETILRVPAIDNLEFATTIENVFVDETKLLEKRFMNLFVSTTVPLQESSTFFKWDVEHFFVLPEITCGPLHQPKSCYINRPINVNKLFIFDGGLLEPASTYKERVVHQEIDFAIGVAASFYVSQKSLTKGAFDYFNNIEKVVNNVGSVFDAPPAAIPGNLFSISDPSEQVLGYFSAVDEKRSLSFIRRGDLDPMFMELPLCGLPGLAPMPLDPSCCNCLRQPNSSTNRPSYWP